MDALPVFNDTDLDAARALSAELGARSTTAGFLKSLLNGSTCLAFRQWQAGSLPFAFAILDKRHTLWFEVHPQAASDALVREIIDWGIKQLHRQAGPDEKEVALNCCARTSDSARISALETNGFTRQNGYGVNFRRPLDAPTKALALPPGFSCRGVRGEDEAEAMVALHRATFGTDSMTLATRLELMRLPGYAPDLDLVVTAPDGSLAAFCFCELERGGQKGVGFSEPIGTHPAWQQCGIAKALLATALERLREKGCREARLSTDRNNLAMQHLARSLGFTPVDDLIWFTREVAPGGND